MKDKTVVEANKLTRDPPAMLIAPFSSNFYSTALGLSLLEDLDLAEAVPLDLAEDGFPRLSSSSPSSLRSPFPLPVTRVEVVLENGHLIFACTLLDIDSAVLAVVDNVAGLPHCFCCSLCCCCCCSYFCTSTAFAPVVIVAVEATLLLLM